MNFLFLSAATLFYPTGPAAEATGAQSVCTGRHQTAEAYFTDDKRTNAVRDGLLR